MQKQAHDGDTFRESACIYEMSCLCELQCMTDEITGRPPPDLQVGINVARLSRTVCSHKYRSNQDRDLWLDLQNLTLEHAFNLRTARIILTEQA